ncbi:MAG: aromatic ring-hydroxylating dioxygenase subunit alpha [Proteobacteria bacterium]|nr:aromatic ring-hydroxylating dioxygenase subunit alpha [Pseudomonadota bacterium]
MAPDSGSPTIDSQAKDNLAEIAARMIDGKTTPLYTLPARWYHADDVYEAERWSVFAATWQFVCREADLPQPGDYTAAKIAGFDIFVLRDRNGALKSFHNLCSHRAAPLFAEGTGHCDVLRCRYHGWTFDHDGKLKAAAHFGECDWFKKEDHGLKPVRLDTWRGLVFVNIDGKAESLADFLSDVAKLVEPYPIESFHRRGGEDLAIKCNWKTYTDNFVEGYHIPGIHPFLSQAIDFSGFETTYGKHVVIMRAPQKASSIYGGLWLWIWPNMTLSVYPDGMNISRIVPHAPRLTTLHYNFYFQDISDALAEAQQKTIDINVQIVREDFGICEDAQDNLEAGVYERGPLSPKHEMGVKYYHDEVRQALKSRGISEDS